MRALQRDNAYRAGLIILLAVPLLAVGYMTFFHWGGRAGLLTIALLIGLGAVFAGHISDRLAQWRRLSGMLYIDLSAVVAILVDISRSQQGATEALSLYVMLVLVLVLVPVTILAGAADRNVRNRKLTRISFRDDP